MSEWKRVQQMWLHSRSFAVATAIALQAWPRHPHSHLLPRSPNGFGDGTLWVGDREHGMDYGKGRLIKNKQPSYAEMWLEFEIWMGV